jgi:hypothetical protein
VGCCGRAQPATTPHIPLFFYKDTDFSYWIIGGKMQDLLDRLQEAGEQTQHLMVRL